MKRITIFALAIVMAGCRSQLTPVDMPLTLSAPPGTPIDTAGQRWMEGIYSVTDGNNTFGDTVMLHWSGDRLCIYCESEVIFGELAGAVSGDTVRFAGYYRFERSVRTGSMVFTVLPDDGGKVIDHRATGGDLILRGTYDGSTEILLRRERPYSPIATNSGHFYILGDRAGGRNSERLGMSENGIPMVKYCPTLGCTGIEIDLQSTADGEVIVFHDDQFTPRSVVSTYILGPINNFTLRQIKRNARLLYGEEIPTLDEFLDAVVDSTDLAMVWLDPKVTDVTEKILQSQQRAMNRANDRVRLYGRDSLKVYYGLPSTDILDAYRKAPSANTTPVICELTFDDVRSLPTCKVWAPRWTNGLQQDMVAQMHAEHKEVWSWTIDSPDYMKDFMREGAFDAILTHYPTMLAALYNKGR